MYYSTRIDILRTQARKAEVLVTRDVDCHNSSSYRYTVSMDCVICSTASAKYKCPNCREARYGQVLPAIVDFHGD